MMTMDTKPPERELEGMSHYWNSGCVNNGGQPYATNLLSSSAGHCVDITRQGSEDLHDAGCDRDVGCSQTPPPGRKPAALAKRNFSTASSTGDDITDCEREMEARRQKRIKANLNERKRSQGINDCIKEQGVRLQEMTDLDVSKLGKKGIMQEFTKCFDQLVGRRKFSKDVLDLAERLVQTGYPAQASQAAALTPYQACVPSNQQQHGTPVNAAPGMASWPVVMKTSAPGAAAAVAAHAGMPHANTSIPMTPTSAQRDPPRNNMNTNAEQEQAQRLQQSTIVPQPLPMCSVMATPTTMTAYNQSGMVQIAPGFSTPHRPSPYLQCYRPAAMQTPAGQHLYVSIPTPNSLVSQSAPSNPSTQIEPPMPQSRKRPSEDSSASDDSSPPMKVARCPADSCDVFDVQQTPQRPAIDQCSSRVTGDRLALLATACELERRNSTFMNSDQNSASSSDSENED
eukprot:scpid49372/ scgid23112/ 